MICQACTRSQSTTLLGKIGRPPVDAAFAKQDFFVVHVIVFFEKFLYVWQCPVRSHLCPAHLALTGLGMLQYCLLQALRDLLSRFPACMFMGARDQNSALVNR